MRTNIKVVHLGRSRYCKQTITSVVQNALERCERQLYLLYCEVRYERCRVGRRYDCRC
jgi:hypothetical protein